MKRATLYSSSVRSSDTGRPGQTGPQPPPQADAAQAPARPARRWRRLYDRFEKPLLVAAGGIFALALVYAHGSKVPVPREITQQDIDSAVVRVRGLGPGDDELGQEVEQGIGTGVVIVDKGIILTNLHVVAGAKRVQVVFYDGLESDATVIGMQVENDLAVLQAKNIPDDLMAATMRSTKDIAPGDEVVAVGFPFGIGPSASAGVVSGLKREFRSPEGKRVLTNLIQFDAAANPGSSGGPLVTADGAVVGIVTAILNPSEQRVFVGIGFAVPIENAASAVGMHPF